MVARPLRSKPDQQGTIVGASGIRKCDAVSASSRARVNRQHRLSVQLSLAAAGIAAVLYAAACAYLWKEQRQLIFLPRAGLARTPADVGLEFRDVSIPVGERSALNAWWLPADSRQPVPAVLLYLRGNDGNLGQEVDRLHALHLYGFSILAIDYRGYGRSSGPPPSEAQVYEDAMAGWDYLVRALDIAPGHIVIYGHSLGGAVATELALRRGPACGVVLEATFTSMSEIARLEYPWIPVDWLLHERFDTLIKISRLDLPMVLVHGTADDEVPPTMTERLYGAARGDKRLVMVKDAGHEQAMPMAGEPMVQAMGELARGCGRRRGS
jgi:fermentation-respiration switch protein FrsA (DUF1100 family)